VTPTLNIAALTHRTGVPADTIRKWEQRYGVLRPERTVGGQRRYTEADVARVEWLKARLEEGFRIGEAAALLGSDTVAPPAAADASAAIVDAALRSDVKGVSAVVEQVLLLDDVAAAFDSILAPALVEIGERWEAGDLSVAQEHLASGAIRAGLQRLLADQRGNVRGVAVLACAPGERHEIGLLMLAVLLRADGWQVAYLGADVPFSEATGFAEQIRADALCFSTTSSETAEGLHGSLAAARLRPGLRVLVGGRGVGSRDPRAAVAELRAAAA
jgi:MerR family transcriptional regulator, light-induced transcriptional regulator